MTITITLLRIPFTKELKIIYGIRGGSMHFETRSKSTEPLYTQGSNTTKFCINDTSICACYLK
jgi:hypothetical protein